MKTFNRIKDILHEYYGLLGEDVKLESQLHEDLDLDSLDQVELGMCIEEDFGLELEDEEASGVKTVGDLVSLVEKKLHTPQP